MHCDIKLDNIIYCKTQNKFKLIDWGEMKFLNKIQKNFATRSTSSMVALYLYGFPRIICPTIMYIDALKNNYKYFKSTTFKYLYE